MKIILYVVNNPSFFVSHRLPLARAASEMGYDVHVATPAGGDIDRILKEKLKHHVIPLSHRGAAVIWQDLHMMYSLYKLYRSLRPDIVHHVTMKPVIYGSLVARVSGVPGIVNATTGLGYLFSAPNLKMKLVREIARVLFRIAYSRRNQMVIFQNSEDHDEFLQSGIVNSANSILIRGGSGVNIDEYSPTPEPEGIPVVLLASRMLWSKGIREFVEAAALLHHEGIKARFVLVGVSDAHSPDAVPTDQLEKWNAGGMIEWMGYCENMPAVLSKANIVCLPSYYREGVPKVLIEAASCARAIITTDTRGCHDIVHHEENGLLIPVQDPHALAQALKRLIQDPGLRQAMGMKGRELVIREFSVNNVAQATLSIYERLLSENK